MQCLCLKSSAFHPWWNFEWFYDSNKFQSMYFGLKRFKVKPKIWSWEWEEWKWNSMPPLMVVAQMCWRLTSQFNNMNIHIHIYIYNKTTNIIKNCAVHGRKRLFNKNISPNSISTLNLWRFYRLSQKEWRNGEWGFIAEKIGCWWCWEWGAPTNGWGPPQLHRIV